MSIKTIGFAVLIIAIVGLITLVIGFVPDITNEGVPQWLENEQGGVRAVGLLVLLPAGVMYAFGAHQGWWP
jgi:hypothetical protein